MTEKGWYGIQPNQTKSYMCKKDLALNDLEELIRHKTKPNYNFMFPF